MFERALKAHPASLELKLRMIDELVTLGRFAEAESRLSAVATATWGPLKAPPDWRLAWYRGRALLAQGKMQETLAAFQSIVDELPGELAPKQALGRAYEASGAVDRAISYYDAVSKADASFTSAALGLARCLEAKGDRGGAAEAFRRVPSTSNRYAQAQMSLARLLIEHDGLTVNDVLAAAAAVDAVEGFAEGLEVHRLRAEVLSAGARLASSVSKYGGDPHGPKVLGVAFREPELRRAAERELRKGAHLADTDAERFRYVDSANAIRPLTLV
jgi:serine/threonine-protein kinase PknG